MAHRHIHAHALDFLGLGKEDMHVHVHEHFEDGRGKDHPHKHVEWPQFDPVRHMLGGYRGRNLPLPRHRDTDRRHDYIVPMDSTISVELSDEEAEVIYNYRSLRDHWYTRRHDVESVLKTFPPGFISGGHLTMEIIEVKDTKEDVA